MLKGIYYLYLINLFEVIFIPSQKIGFENNTACSYYCIRNINFSFLPNINCFFNHIIGDSNFIEFILVLAGI